MPRVHRKGKSRQTDLTWEQQLELTIGGPEDDDPRAFDPTNTNRHTRSYFASPFTRRAAWFQHRERLLAQSNAGQRPWAWWKYEAPAPRLDKDIQLFVGWPMSPNPHGHYETRTWPEPQEEYLERHGLLTDEEKAEPAAIASLKGAE